MLRVFLFIKCYKIFNIRYIFDFVYLINKEVGLEIILLVCLIMSNIIGNRK